MASGIDMALATESRMVAMVSNGVSCGSFVSIDRNLPDFHPRRHCTEYAYDYRNSSNYPGYVRSFCRRAY